MTAPTYDTRNGQTAQEHDQAAPRGSLTDPEADLDGAAAGQPEPGSALMAPDEAMPESVPDSHPAGHPASADGPWNEIQAMFVDDPHASIERAAGLVYDRVEELIESIRARQHSMQSAWQAKDAGTEELRIALQHYRAFWKSLEALPAQAS